MGPTAALQLRVGRQHVAGLVEPAIAAPYQAGEAHRLRLGSAFGEPARDKQSVEALLLGHEVPSPSLGLIMRLWRVMQAIPTVGQAVKPQAEQNGDHGKTESKTPPQPGHA